MLIFYSGDVSHVLREQGYWPSYNVIKCVKNVIIKRFPILVLFTTFLAIPMAVHKTAKD